MIDEETVRQFYRRLNHRGLGVTELVALDRFSGGMVASGFFDDEDRFVSACCAYNPGCHIYAGRNPRPDDIGPKNLMDTVVRKRANDDGIAYVTAVSIDIDPIREKGAPATKKQREAAVSFALDIQWDQGGDVDDSGNGAYVWIPFVTPIKVEDYDLLKEQCRAWQAALVRKYRPERYGLRIDGCFDLSRIKRVIGTTNHKAGRLSRFVRRDGPGDKVRERILSVQVSARSGLRKVVLPEIAPKAKLPRKFEYLLQWDASTRDLWQTPDPLNDRSRHDWMLGMACLEAGIAKPEDLAAILVCNPHGKYMRDGRMDYVRMTVGKLMEQGDAMQTDSK